MKSTWRPMARLAVLGLTAAVTFSAGAAVPLETRSRASFDVVPHAGLVGADGKADVIILLRGEPAAIAYSRAFDAAGRGVMAETAAGNASRAAVAQLESQQETFMSGLRLRARDATEIYRLQRVLNAVAVRMDPADMRRVRAMDGVERVEFIDVKVPDLSTSVNFLGTPRVWEGTPLGIVGVKGEGIDVGIIDTGIDYMHPHFGGTGVLSDYQANNTTVVTEVGAAAFPTARVVGGRDFAGDTYSAGVNPAVPDPDPMDCNGHGSHVAGIAAGGGVNTDNTPYGGPLTTSTNYLGLKIGPGVAPRARLWALRVFGCGGSTSLTASAIEYATDPNGDADLSDRLEVINMSLGSNFGLAFDETALASDAATLTGMIVVASAGNAADTNNISGSPGAGSQVISVANTFDAGLAGPLLINAPMAIQGYRTTGAANFGVPPPLVGGLTAEVVVVQDGIIGAANPPTVPAPGTVTDGCETPFTNAAAVAGKIAFIDRGYCGFKLKARNAELNGAIGVIIGNVATSATPGTAPGMADDPTLPAVNIPTVSLNLNDANLVRTNSPGVNVTLFSGGDLVSASTSRGGRVRAGNVSYLKPDVAAPGSAIASAQTGITCTTASMAGCIVSSASGYIANGASLTISGTSMAAPHVAGLAAIVRQLNPTLLPDDIKALITSTATHDLTTLPGGLGFRFPASRIGAGRIDPSLAATAEIYASNDDVTGAASVLFDDVVVGTATRSRNVRIYNRTATSQNVTLSLDTISDSPGVAFAITSPTTVTIPPAGSTVATIQMTANAADMDRYREPTLAATQNEPFFGRGQTPRAYQAEESALLKVRKGANEVARVAVYMAHRPHSSLHATGGVTIADPATGTANLTLTGTDVCTGTAGPGTCTANLATEHQSLVSPFELQYSGTRNAAIRADGNVQYVGVNYDPTLDRYFFGVQTFGEWDTPTHSNVNICLDTNSDGTFDFTLFSANATNRSFTTGSSNDVFFNYLYLPPPTDDFVLLGESNVLPVSAVDSGLLDNNTAVLSVPGTVLGLAPGGATFRYAVATCPWFIPFCGDIFTNNQQCGLGGDLTLEAVAGPFTYNGAARGIQTTGGLPLTALPLPVLIPAVSGATLPVTYNQDNLRANGAHSVLLLHHLNEDSESADVIPLIDGMFSDGFEDPPVP